MARVRKEKGGAKVAKKSKTGANSKKDVPPKASTASEENPELAREISLFIKDLNLKQHENNDLPEKTTDALASSKKTKKKQAAAPKPHIAAQEKNKKGQTAAPKPLIAVQEKTKKGQAAAKPSIVAQEKTKKGQAAKAAAPKPSIAAPEKPVDPPIILPKKISLNPKSPFISQPVSQWYLSSSPLAPAPAPSTPSPTQLSSLYNHAAELHEKDMRTFQTSSSSNSSSSEANFLSKIIQSGTLSDRLSALTLLVQSSPLHNIKALETLKGMAERGKGQGGREESLKALRCIADWWVGGGAPNRKLKYFRDQPLLHPSATDQHLLVWYFEDWLKKYFFSVLQVLETLSLDPLPYVRKQSMTLVQTLLSDKPEQEQNLLRLLVNKLGDTEKSLCARASHLLLQLLQSHPSMKSVIVREIIALVLRPTAPPPVPTDSLPKAQGTHIRFADAEPKPKPKPVEKEKKGGNVHARYYATVTFNQIVLTPADREVALKLIDIYFEMFKELLGEEPESEVTEASKAGDDEEHEVKIDKGGRIRDRGKGKGKAKSQVTGAAGFAEVEDTQSKLISAILTGVNRALPYAKIDAGDAGINKHIDTLFLITHTSTFNISLQALVLIQQIVSSIGTSSSTPSSSTAKSIADRYHRTLYSSLHDARLATSSKQAMYLNLLFKSIKSDAGNVDGERVKALIRRFVQLLVSGGNGATEFIAGGLYLLGELFSSIPGLRSMISKSEEQDSEETYDPRKRDPQYAHASASPLWELVPLLHHYHPAVSLHARQLLSGQPLTASPDLSQNTLSHFLDRFVYKNPKKIKENENGTIKGKGASVMQPAASGFDGSGVKLLKGEVEDDMRVNEAGFLTKKAENVPVDQLFYFKYFSRKNENEKAKATKIGKRNDHDDESDEEEFGGIEKEAVEVAAEEEEEEEEVESDADEDEIWKAMQATLPKAVGDEELMLSSEDEGEDDEIPSDLDDESSDAEEDGEDDDLLSLVEGSDNEDLVSLDGDIPEGLIDYDGSDAEDDNGEPEQWGGIDDGVGGGKKRKREETRGEKRKKLKSLPTFASYEDYAKMIEDGPEDDV